MQRRNRTYRIGLDERGLAELEVGEAEASAQKIGSAIEEEFPDVRVEIVPQIGAQAKDNFRICNDVQMWRSKNARRILNDQLPMDSDIV